MAPADADARRELRTIRAMPYGSARTAAAEVIVRRIDAEGPQERLAEALLDLVEAYSFTGQGDRSFVTFARLLRLWDSQPELFDESDEHNLFWEFKWVAGDLPDYPPRSPARASGRCTVRGSAGNGTVATLEWSRRGWRGWPCPLMTWTTAPPAGSDIRSTTSPRPDVSPRRSRWG